jgi:HAD superfamily hydrolase (TIGR01549 family)
MSVVIFDVDGTLVDSVKAHASAWQDSLHQEGIDVPFDEIRKQIGKGSDQLLKVFLRPEDLERLEGQLAKRRQEIFMSRYIQSVRPFPRVRDLFRRLREDGHKIVLGTSATTEELRAYLRMIDIDDLIDAETSADDADRSKPHPDIFQAALSKIKGAKPQDAVVVGDTPYDAEAALKGGMKSIGVLTGGFSEEELRKAGAVAVFADIKDMLERSEELPLQPSAILPS